MRRVFPLWVIEEFGSSANDPLETIDPMIPSIFTGSVSMIFSIYAGLEPVFVRVTVYSISFPASTFVPPDAVFVAITEGKFTVKGISITGRRRGVPESLLQVLYA